MFVLLGHGSESFATFLNGVILQKKQRSIAKDSLPCPDNTNKFILFWGKYIYIIFFDTVFPKTDLCQSGSHGTVEYVPAEQFYAETSVARV